MSGATLKVASAYSTWSGAFKKVDFIRIDNSLLLLAPNFEVVGDQVDLGSVWSRTRPRRPPFIRSSSTLSVVVLLLVVLLPVGLWLLARTTSPVLLLSIHLLLLYLN